MAIQKPEIARSFVEVISKKKKLLVENKKKKLKTWHFRALSRQNLSQQQQLSFSNMEEEENEQKEVRALDRKDIEILKTYVCYFYF